LRRAFRTTTPLMAKEITAARAVISVRAGFRWRTSAKTAAMAKSTPAAFRRSGARAGEACGDDGRAAGLAPGPRSE
jgi:hypothetical protein